MRLQLLVLLLGLTIGWGGGHAESRAEESSLSVQLDSVEQGLAGKHDRDLARLQQQAAAVHTQASDCIKLKEEGLTRVTADQALLGDAVSGEAATVAEKRQALSSERLELERELSNCRLSLLRSDELGQRIAERQKVLLQQTLLARGPDVWSLLRDNWTQPAIWIDASREFIASSSGLEQISAIAYALLGVLVVAAFVLSLYWRKRAREWSLGQVAEPSFSSRFSIAFLSVFGQYAPQWLTSSVAATGFYLLLRDVTPLPFVAQVAIGVPIYFVLLTLVYLFLAPKHPEVRLIPMEGAIAAALVRRLSVLMLVLFFGYLLFTTLLVQSLPESALLVARSFYSAALVLNLVWIAGLLSRIPQLQQLAWLRPLFVLVLIGALVVEWLGYRDLSAFIMRALFGSLILLGLFWVANLLLREFFDGLAVGERRWARRARALFGLEEGSRIPALGWLRFFVMLALFGVLLFALLQMWGVARSGLQAVLMEGFQVGSLTIVPARIAIALISLGLLLFFNGWFKARLTSHWIEKMPLERGARETMVTLSGYIGVSVALLVALAVAGVEFGNLAIIAGALSVGIGFGLQNIVNNFVSGLILLFERPVRIGDWVVVGDTEGYVKKISIRSTEIQTFDRADVIVPNSDLISQQVTNYMLHDPRGRVRIPVGVAYGSDVYQVRELLLRSCSNHPLVIQDGSAPAPKVLFRAFGESSLDFELRCYISNIDSKLDVTSDLNFAINDLFREHDIEIPFPQRDIHIINERKEPTPLSQHYRPMAQRAEPDRDSDD